MKLCFASLYTCGPYPWFKVNHSPSTKFAEQAGRQQACQCSEDGPCSGFTCVMWAVHCEAWRNLPRPLSARENDVSQCPSAVCTVQYSVQYWQLISASVTTGGWHRGEKRIVTNISNSKDWRWGLPFPRCSSNSLGWGTWGSLWLVSKNKF